MTIRLDGVKVYTPFPSYEESVPASGGTTKRVTFSLAGEVIAVRVITDTTNTYYYAYTDHLGNVMALSWTGGTFVPGSKARYDPFGTFTTTTPTGSNPVISDHGFTARPHSAVRARPPAESPPPAGFRACPAPNGPPPCPCRWPYAWQ